MKSKLAFSAGLTAGVLATLSATLIAGQVTGLTQFTAGSPAKAAEVNGNFAAVKTAVDDNHARITAAETKLAKFGNNPSPSASGRGAECVVGEILLFAGSVAGAVRAAGQLLPINQNQALCSLLGTKFGGDGQTTFALPNLDGVAPNGLTYTICIEGIFPAQN
jgi:hypothetical protein